MPVGPALLPLAFADLAGWPADDLAAAFAAFRRSALAMQDKGPTTRALGIDGDALARAGARALSLAEEPGSEAVRVFFESAFQPVAVQPETGAAFFTGYYEPDVEASRQRDGGFTIPLYRRPADLVEVDDGNRPPGWPADLRFARRDDAGALQPYPDRAAIEAGALAGRGLELAFLADAVEAFFIHVQGSARLRLPDGTAMRVTYDGKSGHPYTPIGRVIADRAGISRRAVTMPVIRDWLAAHPDEAAVVMQENRSFIFFREAPVADPALGPVAAAGVPLTAGRSLAVDRTLHTFHCPVWIDTLLPDGTLFSRLMITQDTGSAIVGPARGDIFFGSGEAAGGLAGAMQEGGRFVLLVPRP